MEVNYQMKTVAQHEARRPKPKIDRRVAYQLRMIAAGRCRQCGKKRGKDGTTSLCRPCADKVSAKNLANYYAKKAARKKKSQEAA